MKKTLFFSGLIILLAFGIYILVVSNLFKKYYTCDFGTVIFLNEGKFGDVTFVVLNYDLEPLSDIVVEVLNSSGGKISRTNSNGKCFLNTGVADVDKIKIENLTIGSWPHSYYTNYPNTYDGLKVIVVLNELGCKSLNLTQVD